jgi:hypothetical protein
MKIRYIDIDDTICEMPKSAGLDYSQAKPNKKRIEYFNKLYTQGDKIHYWSSRGVGTGKNWLLVTLQQFKEWGVKYHSINLNKPVFDEYIGDKCTNIKDFINKQENKLKGGYLFIGEGCAEIAERIKKGFMRE